MSLTKLHQFANKRTFLSLCDVAHHFSLLFSRDTVVGLFDELVINTKKFVTATSKGIEKWR